MKTFSENPEHNRSLWAISWMSFFWSFGSLMVFSLLPTYMVDVLGTSKKAVGFIEGIALFISFGAKVFAGVLSDVWSSRKPIIAFGSFLTIVMKAGFALSTQAIHVFAARSLDRLIKGWRSAPADALIADLSPAKKEGTSYGVRQALYVLGGVFGGIFASLLMKLSHDNYHLVFWAAVIPSVLAFAILMIFVKESKVHPEMKKTLKWDWREISLLPKPFWILLGVIFFLMLARFSASFLNIRAKECGIGLEIIPLLVSFYEVTHAVSAWPFGKLSDWMDRFSLLFWGILLLTLTNFVIIFIPGFWGIFLGMGLAGVHLGMTQGLISALIAQSALQNLRGTAFALYYCVVGIAVLLGNSIAGTLSDLLHSTAGAFIGGAIFTSIGALLLWYFARSQRLNVAV